MDQTLPPPILIADALGLDFLNSIATPVDTPLEWLDTGEHLLDWLGQSGLAPRQVLEDFRRGAKPGELDALAGQARQLREWFRAFVAAHKGRPLPRQALAELEPLNRVLAGDEAYGQIAIADDGDGMIWESGRRWRLPQALLLPIAEAMARLICENKFEYVKACEGEGCTLLFADRTRGHARRWCSMAVCGNRAKQAAHRARQQ